VGHCGNGIILRQADNCTLVNYLFQNQPLAKGKHAFWLPTRDWQGRPIAAGDFEVRNIRFENIMRFGQLVTETSAGVKMGFDKLRH